MKILEKYLNIFLCLMWIGILINANSHFNHIKGFFNSEINTFSALFKALNPAKITLSHFIFC